MIARGFFNSWFAIRIARVFEIKKQTSFQNSREKKSFFKVLPILHEFEVRWSPCFIERMKGRWASELKDVRKMRIKSNSSCR